MTSPVGYRLRKRIVRDYQSGMGSHVLGTKYGVDPGTIRNIVKRIGEMRRPKTDPVDEGIWEASNDERRTVFWQKAVEGAHQALFHTTFDRESEHRDYLKQFSAGFKSSPLSADILVVPGKDVSMSEDHQSSLGVRV